MQCPKCGSSYTIIMFKYLYGTPFVEYKCGCGWSSLDGVYITTNKTSLYEKIDRTNITQFKKGLE